MKLRIAPAWVKENMGVEISYFKLASAHRSRELMTHKFGHRSVDVSEQALRAFVKKHRRETV